MNNYTRRTTLKKLGLGTIWVSPVVQTVTLPIHAQTSPTEAVYSSSTIAVLVKNSVFTVKIKYFFDGGCSLCGSEVTYEATLNSLGVESNLIATDYGCGTIAPSVLGTASIASYAPGSPSITVIIKSDEVGDENREVPIGGSFEFNGTICT